MLGRNFVICTDNSEVALIKTSGGHLMLTEVYAMGYKEIFHKLDALPVGLAVVSEAKQHKLTHGKGQRYPA